MDTLSITTEGLNNTRGRRGNHENATDEELRCETRACLIPAAVVFRMTQNPPLMMPLFEGHNFVAKCYAEQSFKNKCLSALAS